MQVGLGLGVGVGGEVLGDKPLAKQGAELIAIEHSPSILCLLCTGKSIRVRIIGKDVAGDIILSGFIFPLDSWIYQLTTMDLDSI